MKVLIVGSGGREHALAWRIKQSPNLTRLWVAGGNAGTAALAENLDIRSDDVDAL
ncbi:MAG: phosphoribosylamine--glycine ligase, partial [Chloroflexi bacterium]|nr:phosphoribosylamine--glycine ligase [Chloroflexota bacterium]